MFFTNLEDSNVILDENSVNESIYNDFVEGSLNAIAENEANYTKLIESIGMMESAMYEEEGTVVYTEGMVSSIWENLKKFVIKVWQKIVALFKRFVAMFDQYFAKDKEFVRKYRSRIMQSDTKDLDYTGYTFAGIRNGAAASKWDDFEDIAEAIGLGAHTSYDANSDRQDQVDEITDELRGAMCGKDGKIDASDYADELKEAYYGSDSPESLDNIDLSQQIRYIENSHDAIKAAEKERTRIEKAFKAVIKRIDDKKGRFAKAVGTAGKAYAKSLGADDDTADRVGGRAEGDFAKSNGFATSILHQSSSIITQAIGVYLNALKDRNRQARSICVKAMAKSKKFSNESADMGFEYPAYGESFLSDIEFK